MAVNAVLRSIVLPFASKSALAIAAVTLALTTEAGARDPEGLLPFAERILSACVEAEVVIVGERHGQAGSRSLFLQLVNTLVSRHERVFVGLEIASDRQEDLESALSGVRPPHGVAHPIIDGPSYRELIGGLGSLMAGSGGRLAVRGIDASQRTRETRDAAMASRIQNALDGGYDRILVLAGNFHALKEIPWAAGVREPRERLAQILARSGVSVVSLVQDFRAGCTTGRPVFCSAGDPKTIDAVHHLWDSLNTEDGSLRGSAGTAVDGVVIWKCPDVPTHTAGTPING